MGTGTGVRIAPIEQRGRKASRSRAKKGRRHFLADRSRDRGFPCAIGTEEGDVQAMPGTKMACDSSSGLREPSRDEIEKMARACLGHEYPAQRAEFGADATPIAAERSTLDQRYAVRRQEAPQLLVGGVGVLSIKGTEAIRMRILEAALADSPQ